MRLPTDREILQAIYDRYYPTFAASPGADKKVYVPIDCAEIARRFGVDSEIVFGRLYYHLQKKHGYKAEDGAQIPFFSLRVGGDSHCVNFPLLASVLAALQTEDNKFRWSTGISIASAAISLLALTVSILGFLAKR